MTGINHKTRKLVMHLLVILVIILLIALIYFTFFNTSDKSFESFIRDYGALGLFIGAIIANATILFPVPLDIVIFLIADQQFFGFGILDVLLIGVITGFGSAIGEMSGYIIGLQAAAGVKSIKKGEFLQLDKVKKEVQNLGAKFIILGAFTPFPFDLIGVAAGLVKYNVEKFFIACLIGKTARYILIAYAGYYSIGFIKSLFILF